MLGIHRILTPIDRSTLRRILGKLAHATMINVGNLPTLALTIINGTDKLMAGAMQNVRISVSQDGRELLYKEAATIARSKCSQKLA